MTGSGGQVQALAIARSFLFVPGNRPERFAKALASGADAVIIDLEDAVAPADKSAARAALANAWHSFTDADKPRLLVRVNAVGSSWHRDDLLLLASLKPAAVVVPKAESPASMESVAAALGSACNLVALIESVAGLDAATELAQSPHVFRLAFGNLDFQADLGMAAGPDEAELVPVRLSLVMASRRAGLAPPIDGVTAATQDSVQLQNDVLKSRRMGFGGKLCIHPTQVEAVNTALAPSAEELAWAHRVLQAWTDGGGGVFTLDGRMVDAPVLKLAQRTVAQVRSA